MPELPGGAADGKAYRKALANVEVVIQEWIATAAELGHPSPKPRYPLSAVSPQLLAFSFRPLLRGPSGLWLKAEN